MLLKLKNLFNKYFTYKFQYENDSAAFKSLAEKKKSKIDILAVFCNIVYLCIGGYFGYEIYKDYKSSSVCMYISLILLCLFLVLGVCIHSNGFMKILTVISLINTILFLLSNLLIANIILLVFAIVGLWRTLLKNSLVYYYNLSNTN